MLPSDCWEFSSIKIRGNWYRHTGHLLLFVNHSSRQCWWNTCVHGKTRTTPVGGSKDSIQKAHKVWLWTRSKWTSRVGNWFISTINRLILKILNLSSIENYFWMFAKTLKNKKINLSAPLGHFGSSKAKRVTKKNKEREECWSDFNEKHFPISISCVSHHINSHSCHLRLLFVLSAKSNIASVAFLALFSHIHTHLCLQKKISQVSLQNSTALFAWIFLFFVLWGKSNWRVKGVKKRIEMFSWLSNR